MKACLLLPAMLLGLPVLPSCTQAPPAKTLTAPHFSIRPLGEDHVATQVDPQRGRLAAPLTRDSFREFTIGQGSGRDGFDSVRVFADGSGTFNTSSPSQGGAGQVSFQLSQQERDALIEALVQSRITGLAGMYTSGIWDGTQGFFEVRTSDGRVWSCLDNCWPRPFQRMLEYCEKQIVDRHFPSKPMHGRKADFDGFAEYRRVLGK